MSIKVLSFIVNSAVIFLLGYFYKVPIIPLGIAIIIVAVTNYIEGLVD